MAFCNKCGTQVADGVKFCPSCGNNLEVPVNPQQAGYTQTNNQENFNQTNFNQSNFNQGNYGQQQNYGNSNFMNTPDMTAQFHPQDIANNKVMAVLSYLGLLWLIPFLSAKNSPFAKYHVRQGFVVICAEVGWSIIGFILQTVIRTKEVIGWIEYYRTPWFVVTFVYLVHLAIWAFAIMGIINAINGRAKEVPLIGKIANNFKFLN